MKQCKQYREKIAILAILTIVLPLYVNFYDFPKNIEYVDNEQVSSIDFRFNLKQTVSEPIIIINDQDFESYGFPGLGTKEVPYLLEYLTIETTQEFGIFITNTTKYFKIQYCTVNAGVSAISVSNLTVENIEINSNVCHGEEWYGIYVYSTDNISITNNWCSGGAVGIVCWYSANEFIKNNECNNNEFGIALYETDDTYIGENYCHDNSNAGIHIMYSSNITISKNTIYKTGFGINFISSSLGVIAENYCNATYWGIRIEYSNRATISNNLCSYSNVGIELWHTVKINVTENECHTCRRGIDIEDDSESRVQNNICFNNLEHGIYIKDGRSTLLSNNTLSLNKLAGIKVYKGAPIVLNNNCSFNKDGIVLRYVQSLTLSNNTCYNNIDGIVLEETDFSTISYNTLQENIEYGIKIWDLSTWNKIHHNYFICNNIEGTDHGFSQAYDEGYNNRWYESSTDEGNYYNDYRGEGEYQIDGKDNNTDPYPFIYNYECPKTEIPTEESLISTFIILLSVLGTSIVFSKKYKGY